MSGVHGLFARRLYAADGPDDADASCVVCNAMHFVPPEADEWTIRTSALETCLVGAYVAGNLDGAGKSERLRLCLTHREHLDAVLAGRRLT